MSRAAPYHTAAHGKFKLDRPYSTRFDD
jgi:hypothetical protein